MSTGKDELDVLDRAADQVVRLGNQLSEQGGDNDMWDVASGILAGAIQFWRDLLLTADSSAKLRR